MYTGHTIVERESRISEADVIDLLGLAQYESEVCSCGYHPSIATDETNLFQPEALRCPVCAGATQEDRFQHDRDEQWSKSNPNASPRANRPGDGRRMFMRLLSPEEVAAREKPAAKPEG